VLECDPAHEQKRTRNRKRNAVILEA
jgi:hypothetical protein